MVAVAVAVAVAVVVAVGVGVAVVVAVGVGVGVAVGVAVVVGVVVGLVFSKSQKATMDQPWENVGPSNCGSCGAACRESQLVEDCGELVCAGCKAKSDESRELERIFEMRAIAREWFVTEAAERVARQRWAEGYFGFQRRSA